MKSWRLAAFLAVLAGIPAARADIMIALAAPITGDNAPFGEQMRRGAEAAVRDLDAQGGVLGQQVQLIIGDDSCDPKQAVSVANDLAARHVALVAGHFCSGSSIPASDVYNDEGILQISPASTNPLLTERGLPYVFRTCGRDDQQGRVAARYILDHFPGKTIAVIHDKQAYSKGLADETRKNLNAAGVHEVLYDSITKGEKDYAALVSKLKENKVDVLYYGGYYAEAGLILRQMRDQGLKTVLIGGDALMTSEFWSISGIAGNGSLTTFSPDPRKLSANAALVDRFRKTGYDPEGYVFYTYAAIQAWAQAASAAGTVEAAPVAKLLKSKRFETALGPITFDAKGDVAKPGYVMYRWQDGKYDYAP